MLLLEKCNPQTWCVRGLEGNTEAEKEAEKNKTTEISKPRISILVRLSWTGNNKTTSPFGVHTYIQNTSPLRVIEKKDISKFIHEKGSLKLSESFCKSIKMFFQWNDPEFFENLKL